MNANTVEIDPAALAAEAQRALAGAVTDLTAVPSPEGAAAAAAAPAGAAEPPAAQSWRPLVEGVTPMLRMVVFAQWQIPEAHQAEFVASASATFDLLFPGGLDGKWAPCVRLLACCGGIVVTNYVANGNKLPPLGIKKPKPDDDKPRGAEAQRAAA